VAMQVESEIQSLKNSIEENKDTGLDKVFFKLKAMAETNLANAKNLQEKIPREKVEPFKLNDASDIRQFFLVKNLEKQSLDLSPVFY
jgi:hypothetical protein